MPFVPVPRLALLREATCTIYDGAMNTVRLRSVSVNPMDFAEFYDVPAEPLPEWSHRPYEEYRSYVADLVYQSEEEHFERRNQGIS